MKSYRLKKEGMVLLTTSIKWFLLTVLLSSGCSEGHRVPSCTLSLPQQGDIINELFNIGDTLPSFTAIDSEGAPYVVDGSKYGDRYTMIVFWRGDPAFYESSIPRFTKLYERFNEQGFEIISINTDSASEESQAMANKRLVPWTNLRDHPDNGLVNEFKLRISQSIFLLDGAGTIISSHRHMNSADISVDPWTGETQHVHGTDWTINKLFNNE